MSNNESAIWVRGNITNLLVTVDDWANPTPTGRSAIFIYMKELPKTENGYNRVIITSDHPAYETAFKFALSAVEKSMTISLRYINSNIVHKNAWDFSMISLCEG